MSFAGDFSKNRIPLVIVTYTKGFTGQSKIYNTGNAFGLRYPESSITRKNKQPKNNDLWGSSGGKMTFQIEDFSLFTVTHNE